MTEVAESKQDCLDNKMCYCDRRMTRKSSCGVHDAIIQDRRCKLKCIEESITSALTYFRDQRNAGGGKASAKDHNEAHEKYYSWLRTARQRNA